MRAPSIFVRAFDNELVDKLYWRVSNFVKRDISKPYITDQWVSGTEVLDCERTTVYWTVCRYCDSPSYAFVAKCVAAR